MNYIQKLKWQRDLLIEFFHGYVQLDTAHKRLENTAYKGDAMNAVKAAYARLDKAKKDIEVNILASIKTEEEKKNA